MRLTDRQTVLSWLDRLHAMR